MTEVDQYVRAASLADVFSQWQTLSPPVKLLCGGTDLFVKLPNAKAPYISLIDISRVPELSGIERVENYLRIGAATKLTDVVESTVFSGAAQILPYGASQVGSLQIRNLASLGGNLCNAAPSADTSAPLLALDAEVELHSAFAQRRIKLAEFFVGPGQTVLADQEMVSAIWVPDQPQDAAGMYVKHCVRGAMELALVGVAMVLWRENGKLAGRIALGAVAPTPLRAYQAEALLGELDSLGPDECEQIAQQVVKAARPISDVRASADYRTAMIGQITKRILTQVYEQLERGLE